jgi:hypothetical protein
MKVKPLAVSLFFSLGFVVFSFGSAFGQKSASFKELYDLKTEARKTLATRPRRVVVKIQDHRDPTQPKSEETVYEYLAENRSRFHTKLADGKTRTEFERIVVGEFQYTRENIGNWRKSNLSDQIAAPSAGIEPNDGSCIVRELGVHLGYADTLPAYIYSEIAFVNGKAGIVQILRQTWMGLDGSILKETEDRDDFFDSARWRMLDKSESYKSSVSYEYDPRIKIESPIQ